MATIQAGDLGSFELCNKSIEIGDDTSPIKPSSSPQRNFNKTSRRTMPKIGRYNQSMDPTTEKKLFGTITVEDMALAGSREDNMVYGIKHYQVNSELRYNFGNKIWEVPK